MDAQQMRQILSELDAALAVYARIEKLTAKELSQKSILAVVRAEIARGLASQSAASEPAGA